MKLEPELRDEILQWWEKRHGILEIETHIAEEVQKLATLREQCNLLIEKITNSAEQEKTYVVEVTPSMCVILFWDWDNRIHHIEIAEKYTLASL